MDTSTTRGEGGALTTLVAEEKRRQKRRAKHPQKHGGKS